VPHWVGADRQLRQSYTQAGHSVLLELDYYVTQRQDAELINSQNFMVRQKKAAWSNVGESIVTVQIDGQARQVRQARLRGSNGQRILVWQWNLINQRPVVSDPIAKLILAFDRVRLQRDDGLSVLIATPYGDADIKSAAATLARFAADMEPAIGRTLDQVDGQ
jgi:EpsI family protein